MKHLKIYEIIGEHPTQVTIIPKDSMLSNFFEKRKEYETLKNNIIELVNEYVRINRNYFDDQYFLDYGANIIDIFNNDKYMIANKKSHIELVTNHNHYINLRQEDSKKLIEFLEDPDLYRNQKKYNL